MTWRARCTGGTVSCASSGPASSSWPVNRWSSPGRSPPGSSPGRGHGATAKGVWEGEGVGNELPLMRRMVN